MMFGPRLRGASRAALLVSGLMLAGCSSIPLSTLWQLRGFTGDRLTALEPARLRVAARVDSPAMRLDPHGMRLSLEFISRDTAVVERHEFSLRPAKVFDAVLTAPAGRPWTVLELDDAGLQAMRVLQPKLSDAKARYSEFTFSVSSSFDGPLPTGTREIVMSVRLQLAGRQAPMTVLDRARIELGRD
jgi:hypothetical protein